MPSCCSASHERVFDAREAQKAARRYRTKGLDDTALRIVRFLVDRGVADVTVLEIGGGIGAIQLELLQAGAATATNVELSPCYEVEAKDLLERAGLHDRVERVVLDFAKAPDAIAAADLVIMHRVVCCYPDVEPLVAAAAQRARRYMAMSFPTDHLWVRLAVAIENLFHQITRTDFRAYFHPPPAIVGVARAYGLDPILEHRGWMWTMTLLERAE